MVSLEIVFVPCSSSSGLKIGTQESRATAKKISLALNIWPVVNEQSPHALLSCAHILQLHVFTFCVWHHFQQGSFQYEYDMLLICITFFLLVCSLVFCFVLFWIKIHAMSNLFITWRIWEMNSMALENVETPVWRSGTQSPNKLCFNWSQKYHWQPILPSYIH